jgi:hypothetical protein
MSTFRCFRVEALVLSEAFEVVGLRASNATNYNSQQVLVSNHRRSQVSRYDPVKL